MQAIFRTSFFMNFAYTIMFLFVMPYIFKIYQYLHVCMYCCIFRIKLLNFREDDMSLTAIY